MGGRGSGSYTAGQATVGFGGAGSGKDLPVAGWTPEAGSNKVHYNVTVAGVEDRIRDLDHEQMAIIGKDGYVLAAVDGAGSSVSITSNAAKYIKGNDVYHNHPNGGTLSTTDVITGGYTEVGSISAVSRNMRKTYTLKATSKANGSGLAKAMQRDENKLLKAWQDKANSMTGKKYSSEASYKKALNTHWNNIMGDWMNKNAGKYGYTYSTTKGGK